MPVTPLQRLRTTLIRAGQLTYADSLALLAIAEAAQEVTEQHQPDNHIAPCYVDALRGALAALAQQPHEQEGRK